MYIYMVRQSSRGKPGSSQGHFGVTGDIIQVCEKPEPVLKAFDFNVCVYVNVKEF